MDTWRRHWTVRGVAVMLAASVLSGCGIARINHLHSDANQKQMEKAIEAFNQTTSDRAGLGPTLLKNLETVTALRRTVADVRSNVDDVDRATELLSKTWLGVRAGFLSDLGFERPPAGPSPGSALTRQRAFVGQAGKELSERIERRVDRIEAVIKVLGALIAGDRALAAQAKADVERSMQPAVAQPPSTTQQAATSLVALLGQFQSAVIQAGREAAKDAAARAAATALEKALRDEATRSRDPAAVYALVAVVGTGLGENGFQGLDAFLEYLEKRLAELAEKAEQACPSASGTCPPGWKEFLVALKDASHLTTLGRLQSLVSDAKANSARLSRAVSDHGLARRLDALGQARSVVPDVIAPSKGFDPTLAQKFISNVREKIEGAHMSTVRKKTDAKKADAQKEDAEKDAGKADLDASITTLLELTDKLSDEVDALREKVEALPVSFDSITALLGSSTGGSGDASKLAAGSGLLKQALASDPKLAARLDGAVKEDDLKQLGSLIADIGKERTAAGQRIADYLKALHRIQLDLHEETLRHDQVIVAIAAQEIKRWKLIQEIDDDTADVFKEPGACEANKIARPAAVLFATSMHVACWRSWYDRTWPKHSPPQGGAHPVVAADERVLPTIRRLAETANVWQTASPNAADPLGFDTAASNHRLWTAVHVLNAHLLMGSVNERLAADNRIRLSTEVAEHRLHLDGIAARAEEAGLNLALGDAAAFHASGITQTDLQTFFSIVQSVLLAYIGGKI